jgi:MFS family permease
MASSAALAVTIFGVANILQGVGGMIGNFCAGLLASFNGSFVGVYAVIGLVALLMAGVTLRLPRESEEVPPVKDRVCLNS